VFNDRPLCRLRQLGKANVETSVDGSLGLSHFCNLLEKYLSSRPLGRIFPCADATAEEQTNSG
jgi:hypothetical protein